MSKSVYNQHSQSTLLETAKALIQWQENLLRGRARPNNVEIAGNKLQEMGMEECCPDSSPMVYDAGDYRNDINDINYALRRIFLLENKEVLREVLDRNNE